MRLKELREQKCLSQLDVARGINTSQRNIGRWENGENEPSSSVIISLANYFDVTTDYLLGRESEFGVVESKSNIITTEETELLSCFKLLSLEDKNKVIGFVRALAY